MAPPPGISSAAALNQSRPASLALSTAPIKINGRSVDCLFDSGSTVSVVHPDTASRLSLNVLPSRCQISLASKAKTAEASGHCLVELTVNGVPFPNFRLCILPHLCAPVLLGLDFQRHMRSVTRHFNGPLPPLAIRSRPAPVCGLSALKVEPPALFANLTDD